MNTKPLPDSMEDDSATWIVSDDTETEHAPAQIAEDNASGSFQSLSSDQQPILVAMHHLGLPLMTFGGCLCVLMVVLMCLFTPDRFPVRIGDTTIPLAALTGEQEALHREESRLLDERRSIDQLVPTPTLQKVRQLAAAFVPVGSALNVFSTIRQTFAINGLDPVRIDELQIDGQTRRITVSGRMLDATRSVEMLASFVDNLRQHPIFASVSEPDYQVLRAEDGTNFSPFTLTLTIANG